ncbi:MAG: hypothetical protein M1832_001149 [Thelocarpon impressellum]|nr:MAG: hypothetical protein M1832_001149 [Thelocarpon impressellum]
MTGTKIFMAIGALRGEHHTFMHDLESFFWVLIWTCVHWNGPGKERQKESRFTKWNYAHTEELATLKKGEVDDEKDFDMTTYDGYSFPAAEGGAQTTWGSILG